MLPYIVLIFVLMLLSRWKRRDLALYSAMAILMLMGGLRGLSVGTDTINYSYYFTNFGEDASFTHALEFGYFALHLFVLKVFGEYQVLVLFISIITIFFVGLFAKRESENPAFSMLCYVMLYFWFYSLNTARQFIAVSIVLMGLSCLRRGKIKQFILWIILAMSFHTVSIVAFSALLFRKPRGSRALMLICILGTFFLGLVSFVPAVLSKMIFIVPEYMIDYIIDADAYRETFSLSRLMLSVYCCALVLLLDHRSLYLKCLVLGIMILNLFSFQPVIGRTAQFFTVVQIVLIPNIPSLIKQPHRRPCSASSPVRREKPLGRYMKYSKKIDARKTTVPLQVFSFCYMLAVLIVLLHSNNGEVVPYRFFF